jgi:hypothetical protein
MPIALSCAPRCQSIPNLVNIPGTQGQTGPQGPAGPAGSIPAPVSAYGAGTPYTLTTNQSLLALANVQPSVALPVASTYLLFARARFDLVGAIADIPNTQRSIEIPIVTTASDTLPTGVIPVVAYSASAGDNIQMFGALSTLPSAGSVQCVEADLIAVNIGSSGSSSQVGGVTGGTVDPTVAPPSPNAIWLYMNLTSGTLWTWNPIDQEWQ